MSRKVTKKITTTRGTGRYKDVGTGKFKKGKQIESTKDYNPFNNKYEKIEIMKKQEIMETVTEEVTTETPKPGRFGYLRNMLINTRVLNEAFIAYPVLSFAFSCEKVFKSSFEMAASKNILLYFENFFSKPAVTI